MKIVIYDVSGKEIGAAQSTKVTQSRRPNSFNVPGPIDINATLCKAVFCQEHILPNQAPFDVVLFGFDYELHLDRCYVSSFTTSIQRPGQTLYEEVELKVANCYRKEEPVIDKFARGGFKNV